MSFRLFLCMLVASVGFGQGAFPADWKKCSKTDMDCLKDAISGAVKSLAQGINPGLPKMDPMYFGKLTLLDGKDGKGKLEYRDLYVKGLTGTIINNVEPAGSDGIIITFTVPHFDCLGKYEMNTKLVGIAMNGIGDLEMNFGNIKASIEITFGKKSKGSKTVYRAEEVKVKAFATESFRVYHHNLFNGNKQLEESINKALNEDWKGLIKELVHYGTKAFSESYQQLANSVFDQFSVDDIELPSA